LLFLARLGKLAALPCIVGLFDDVALTADVNGASWQAGTPPATIGQSSGDVSIMLRFSRVTG
jgi:hypothetical protein